MPVIYSEDNTQPIPPPANYTEATVPAVLPPSTEPYTEAVVANKPPTATYTEAVVTSVPPSTTTSGGHTEAVVIKPVTTITPPQTPADLTPKPSPTQPVPVVDTNKPISIATQIKQLQAKENAGILTIRESQQLEKLQTEITNEKMTPEFAAIMGAEITKVEDKPWPADLDWFFTNSGTFERDPELAPLGVLQWEQVKLALEALKIIKPDATIYDIIKPTGEGYDLSAYIYGNMDLKARAVYEALSPEKQLEFRTKWWQSSFIGESKHELSLALQYKNAETSDEAKQAIKDAPENILALAPFVQVGGTVDISRAIDGGIKLSVLESIGVTKEQVADYKTNKIIIQQQAKTYEAAIAQIGQPGEGGYDIGELLNKGVSASTLALVFKPEDIEAAKLRNEATESIEKYKSKDGYNLTAAKIDGVSNETLKLAGFKDTAISEADLESQKIPDWNEWLANYKPYHPGKDVAYDEYVKRFGVGAWIKSAYKDAGEFVVDMAVPLVWLRNADKMSPLEIAANIAFDAMIIIPVGGMALRAAEKGIVRTIGTEAMKARSLLTEISASQKAAIKAEAKIANIAYGNVIGKSDLGIKTIKLGEANAKYVNDALELKLAQGAGVNPAKIVKLESNAIKSANNLAKVAKEYSDTILSAESKRISGFKGEVVGGSTTKFEGIITKEGLVRDTSVRQEIVDLSKNAKRYADQLVDDIIKPIAKSPKQELIKLNKELDSVSSKLRSTLEKGQLSGDLYLDIARIKAKISAIKYGSPREIQSKLISLRDELKELQKQRPKTAADRLKWVKERTRIEKQIADLDESLVRSYKDLEIEWQKDNRPLRGGGTAVQERTKSPTSSGSLVESILERERRPITRLQGAIARPVQIVENIKISEFATPKPDKVGTTAGEISERTGMMAKLSSRTDFETSSLAGISESTRVSPGVGESTETRPAEETKTKPKTETKTATITDTKTRVRDKIGDRFKPRMRLPLDDKSKLLAELGNPQSAIAWRMGKVNNQNVYYVVVSPFKSESDVTIFVGKLPEGAKEARGGAKSAYKSIQILTGKAPAHLSLDIGATDALITGKPLNIKFRADPKQRTKSDITVRKGRVKVIKGLKLSR